MALKNLVGFKISALVLRINSSTSSHFFVLALPIPIGKGTRRPYHILVNHRGLVGHNIDTSFNAPSTCVNVTPTMDLKL